MNPRHRHLALALVLGVVIAAVAAVVARSDNEAPREKETVGIEEVRVVCSDVRAAAETLDSAYAALAATVLDHAVIYADRARQFNTHWEGIAAAAVAFHDATHGTDAETIASTRAAAVESCNGIAETTAR